MSCRMIALFLATAYETTPCVRISILRGCLSVYFVTSFQWIECHDYIENWRKKIFVGLCIGQKSMCSIRALSHENDQHKRTWFTNQISISRTLAKEKLLLSHIHTQWLHENIVIRVVFVICTGISLNFDFISLEIGIFSYTFIQLKRNNIRTHLNSTFKMLHRRKKIWFSWSV